MTPTRQRRNTAADALANLAEPGPAPRATKSLDNRVGQFTRASYDSAKTTNENARHWANADSLSAVADGSLSVRKLLRTRARYEVANNSIARGIVLTLANDLVGSGPRVQLNTDDKALNKRVERLFNGWTRAVGLAAKLRTMRQSRCQDGEAFGVFVENPAVPSPVKLDLQLVEADRVTSPQTNLTTNETVAVDGILYDQYGNPVEYHVLKQHPGALGGWASGLPNSFDELPARNVVHWFRVDRPGQRRGIPDIAPALPLFAQLRRFTLATLTAAETAADISLVMKTNAPAGGEAAEVEPWVTMDLQRNMAMFAPEGWEPSQMQAEHPTSTFAMFRHALINEIARCLNMPYNIAAGDSAGYNYASGRLDHQTYFKAIDVDRSHVSREVLDPLFIAWLNEAQLVSGLDLFGEIARSAWPTEWLWDSREHVDPLREAKAQDVRLKNKMTNYAREYARQGLDYRKELEQVEREEDEFDLDEAEPSTSGA